MVVKILLNAYNLPICQFGQLITSIVNLFGLMLKISVIRETFQY